MRSLILSTTMVLPLVLAAESHQKTGPGDAFLNHYDSNNDGKVSLQEYQAPAAKQFLMMDLDADGNITPDEATAFVEKIRDEMMKGRTK